MPQLLLSGCTTSAGHLLSGKVCVLCKKLHFTAKVNQLLCEVACVHCQILLFSSIWYVFCSVKYRIIHPSHMKCAPHADSTEWVFSYHTYLLQTIQIHWRNHIPVLTNPGVVVRYECTQHTKQLFTSAFPTAFTYIDFVLNLQLTTKLLRFYIELYIKISS